MHSRGCAEREVLLLKKKKEAAIARNKSLYRVKERRRDAVKY